MGQINLLEADKGEVTNMFLGISPEELSEDMEEEDGNIDDDVVDCESDANAAEPDVFEFGYGLDDLLDSEKSNDLQVPVLQPVKEECDETGVTNEDIMDGVCMDDLGDELDVATCESVDDKLNRVLDNAVDDLQKGNDGVTDDKLDATLDDGVKEFPPPW